MKQFFPHQANSMEIETLCTLLTETLYNFNLLSHDVESHLTITCFYFYRL
jgi:hypothetical protein